MKKIILFLIISFTISAQAGFNGLTHHSRANCINNETISWDFTKDWQLKTISHHRLIHQPSERHVVTDDMRLTWRSAAVHWGEGRGDWVVEGEHYSLDNRGKEYMTQNERITDCSIYDGWWDRNSRDDKGDDNGQKTN